MTWTEFLIIYLACGAPFAVYRITQIERLSVGQVPGLLGAFLAWPILAAGVLVNRLFPAEDARSRSLDLMISQTRAAIEEAGFPTRAAEALLGFREVYDRYAGLALASCQKARVSTELFEVSGHKKPEVATQVLARRSREKLLFHHTQARNEFVDLIAGLTLDSDEVIHLACDLANALGDHDAVADLNALIARPAPGQRTRSGSAAASVR